MDTQNETQEKSSGCGCHGWHKHRGFRLVKLIVVLLLLGLIFSAGFALGNLKSMVRYGKFGYLMMGGTKHQGIISDYENGNFPCGGMMGGWGYSDNKNTSQISGTISKVEGTKITVMDNGNQEKVILSTSNTSIVSVNSEVGLSFLKAGQNISASGEMKNNQLEAKVIRIY